MNTMTIESMLIIIKTQREYLTELAEEKKKLIRENERLTSELAFNSNSLEKIRKNHINDLIRLMEMNIELEKTLNEVNKKNESLIDEKRKHAETTDYDGKCVCVNNVSLCPDYHIKATESKDSFFSMEDFNDTQNLDIECIGTRINDDDDEYEVLIEKAYIKKNTNEILVENDIHDNIVEIDDTIIYYDIYDENLPLIERIDRCLNNASSENERDSNLFTNCYDDNSITYQLITKDKDNYNNKKNDDNIFDDEFDNIMTNGKNEYVDNYLSNRL